MTGTWCWLFQKFWLIFKISVGRLPAVSLSSICASDFDAFLYPHSHWRFVRYIGTYISSTVGGVWNDHFQTPVASSRDLPVLHSRDDVILNSGAYYFTPTLARQIIVYLSRHLRVLLYSIHIVRLHSIKCSTVSWLHQTRLTTEWENYLKFPSKQRGPRGRARVSETLAKIFLSPWLIGVAYFIHFRNFQGRSEITWLECQCCLNFTCITL